MRIGDRNTDLYCNERMTIWLQFLGKQQICDSLKQIKGHQV